MRVLAPYGSAAFVTVFCSKSASTTFEVDMYLPFSEALNDALEALSEIQVNGLPDFKTHIAFVPCNKGIASDRDLPGSSFKPDIALMLLQDAHKFYELDQLDTSKVSQFIGKIAGKPPPGFIGWKSILSAIEVKRKSNMSGWALPETLNEQDKQVGVIRDADRRLDEKSDDSRLATCKVNPLL